MASRGGEKDKGGGCIPAGRTEKQQGRLPPIPLHCSKKGRCRTHEANGNGMTGTDFKSNYGWDTFGGENGTNASGFAALPSTPDGYLHQIGSDIQGGKGDDGAVFWSSYTGFTNKINLGHFLMIYKKNSTHVESNHGANVSYLANIRCIKD